MEQALNTISKYIVYLVVLAILLNFKKLSRAQVYFAYYILWQAVLEYINTWAVRVLHNSIWVWDFGLLVDLSFLSWFYHRFSHISDTAYKRYKLAVLLITLISLYKYFIAKDYMNINYNLMLLMILLILICGSVLLNMFDGNSVDFNQSFIFWISFSRLFYLMMILPFNVFQFIGSHIDDAESMDLYYWIDRNLNYIANTILNIVYAYSFTCRK